MKSRRLLSTIFIGLFAAVLALGSAEESWASRRSKSRKLEEPFRKGFTYLKWGDQFSEHAERSFTALKTTGAEWVSFVPIYYMDSTRSTNIYRHPVLSPTDNELADSIRKAQSLGFKVLLKPHVDVMTDPWKSDWPKPESPSKEPWLSKYRAFVDRYPISHNGASAEKNWFRRLFEWRGEIRPVSDAEIAQWFADYTKMIVHFAQLAAQLKVDLFCVGTEFEQLSDQTARWEAVIAEVRKVYSGKILYDANHDGILKVKFWNKLDYVGTSAYFPMSDKRDPAESELRTNLDKVLDRLESKTLKQLRKEHKRDFEVLFGEAGYTDFRGTARTPWDFLLTDGVNVEEQAKCYRSSLLLYPKRKWLKGVFFWRWSVEPEDKYFDYDHYSPYGKPAEEDIRKAWGGSA